MAAAIERVVGPATPPRDATLADVLAGVPASRLPRHRLVVSDAEARVRHGRGQSLPDMVALRTGRLDALPDGVAFPNDASEVRELLSWAAAVGARVVPYGGGTSVVGGVTPAGDGAPWLTVSLARLAGLSDDPAFVGYPYPLARAHQAARRRPTAASRSGSESENVAP